jgi:SPP1 family phage portal protein
MFDYSMQDNAIRIIKDGANRRISDRDFIIHEINRTMSSIAWKWMMTGDDYYVGKHDVLAKQRTVIGTGGEVEEVDNLPNNKNIDNVYRRMVKQKNNYLFGKPFAVDTDNDAYTDILNGFFDKRFLRTLKTIGRDFLNCGIAWLYIYYDEQGELKFKRFRPYEVIPEWKDIDHTELDSLIRFYQVDEWDGYKDSKVTKVEYYKPDGIYYFESFGGTIEPCEPYHTPYFSIGEQGYNWDKLPFVAFKYNQEEQPLIQCCKSLQDGLNQIISAFEDVMEEDTRNTILVLVNYDGENLAEFRKNLATYGAVKVRSSEGANGDVRTLQVEVNAENYKAIIEVFKRAIIENCMGFDAKDTRMGGSPNQMNIQSMYSDIDLDASDTEVECQAAFESLMYFINLHLINSGLGDFSNESVTITFNTDLPMDETSKIQNIKNSVGIVSDETLLANHPWVADPKAELERVNEQKLADIEQYENAFAPQQAEPNEEAGINEEQ